MWSYKLPGVSGWAAPIGSRALKISRLERMETASIPRSSTVRLAAHAFVFSDFLCHAFGPNLSSTLEQSTVRPDPIDSRAQRTVDLYLTSLLMQDLRSNMSPIPCYAAFRICWQVPHHQIHWQQVRTTVGQAPRQSLVKIQNCCLPKIHHPQSFLRSQIN